MARIRILQIILAQTVAVALSAGLAAGCAAPGGTAERTNRPPVSPESETPPPTPAAHSVEPAVPTLSPSPKEATEIASQPSAASEDVDHPTPRADGPATPASGRRPFALFGLKPGDAKDHAVARLGPPTSTYVLLDGETGGILVHEYGGFQIGFDPEGRIVFIDVRSQNVDPGLGGIRVHTDGETVVRVLGRPTARTERVLTYERDGAVLKFDLDPGRGTVLSIKLFAASPREARP